MKINIQFLFLKIEIIMYLEFSQNPTKCFLKMSGELPAETLKTHTYAHAVLDRPTLKDVYERTFRKKKKTFQGMSSISNLSNLENNVKRVHTSSH